MYIVESGSAGSGAGFSGGRIGLLCITGWSECNKASKAGEGVKSGETPGNSPFCQWRPMSGADEGSKCSGATSPIDAVAGVGTVSVCGSGYPVSRLGTA